jgi:hypothetical protein
MNTSLAYILFFKLRSLTDVFVPFCVVKPDVFVPFCALQFGTVKKQVIQHV